MPHIQSPKRIWDHERQAWYHIGDGCRIYLNLDPEAASLSRQQPGPGQLQAAPQYTSPEDIYTPTTTIAPLPDASYNVGGPLVPAPGCSVGDWVYLDIREWHAYTARWPTAHAGWAGPLRVLQQVARNDYRLELPTSSQLYPVFPVSKLRPVETWHNAPISSYPPYRPIPGYPDPRSSYPISLSLQTKLGLGTTHYAPEENDRDRQGDDRDNRNRHGKDHYLDNHPSDGGQYHHPPDNIDNGVERQSYQPYSTYPQSDSTLQYTGYQYSSGYQQPTTYPYPVHSHSPW